MSNKYNDFVAKAKAIKDIGEYITSRIESIKNDIKWYDDQRRDYLAECEAQGNEASEWRMADFDDSISSNEAQIKTLEKIEKYLEKEMGA